MSKAPGEQTRLDDVLAVDPEARAEKQYQERRDARTPHPAIPYEQRVAAWIREREQTMKRRAVLDAAQKKGGSFPEFP